MTRLISALGDLWMEFDDGPAGVAAFGLSVVLLLALAPLVAVVCAPLWLIGKGAERLIFWYDARHAAGKEGK